MLRINNIKIRSDLKNEEVLDFALKKNKIKKEDIIKWSISKKSIDARKKDDIFYVYSIDIKVKDEKKYHFLDKIKDFNFPSIEKTRSFSHPPIIIGAGPSGLFTALTFIENGVKPIVIEQGQDVDERKKTIDTFFKTGKLNTLSNVQFGEGGAGTFSDGKLNSGINSPYCKKVLEKFVFFGAPEEILYLSKPHIGTDKLIGVIKNMREYMIKKGAKFYFNTKACDFLIKDNKINGIIVKDLLTNEEREIPATDVILAIGHSSRNTFYKLFSKNIYMEKKNFSVGVRIEHLQSDINKAQYGTITTLNLPPADYKLACHLSNGRSCYTFCMCPGGTVIGSSSEENTIVTNGMSNFLRDGKNANSAVLVNVTPSDFKDSSPLSGIDFQKDLEEKAFILGGSNYFAPIQRFQDFVENKKTTKLGRVTPSYKPGVTFANLNEILPRICI